MKSQASRILATFLLLAVGMPVYSDEPDAEQEAYVKEIEKMGGRVHLDQDKAVDAVRFKGKVTTAAWEMFKSFKGLRALTLDDTDVTDAGLNQLKELNGSTGSC